MPPIPGARVVTGIPMPRAAVTPVLPGSGNPWEAKYPEFAIGSGEELGHARTAEEAEAAAGSDPWTISPASSHTEMFRLVDAGSVREITAYDVNGYPIKVLTGGTKLAIINARSGLGSTIDVRFKPQGRRPAYEYVYFFGQNHAGAREVYNEMAASESPWTVGYQKLEKAGIPYRRVSGS